MEFAHKADRLGIPVVASQRVLLIAYPDCLRAGQAQFARTRLIEQCMTISRGET